MGFFEFLGNAGKTIGDNFGSVKEWLSGSGKDGTSNFLTALGTAGNIYDSYSKYKANRANNKLMKEQWDYNKMLANRSLNKENTAQNNLANAWNTSLLARKDDEERKPYGIL
ncbi:hypothetical protein CPIN18021_0297 [Campylobacter pinnipediorum subsp. caledonicus]|uniref:Uncharacterized protein n=2 Tax=Campylobacter TaxID=194 RepID=A0A1S6U5Y6_9BACT|nr:hypothetical protein [Campylobacter pinnipediorum]AQW85559.1 hypothetical protein CPIN18020_0318 [Campylobacter pinnipediorum subsp. caledonicus]AQW87144.1 hypothetical protein CPIN18021_0297 [Campylobacter pinnipediorum subsp. caledonicus]OPA71842.1 hypothetical protein BB381_06810 [Campylobacter pinnipediorum subsp. caledonicus]